MQILENFSLSNAALEGPTLLAFSVFGQKADAISLYKSSNEERLKFYTFNCENNGVHIKKVDGSTASCEESLQDMRDLLCRSNNPNSLFVGSARAGYAATLYGSQCGVRRVIAFGTEIITGYGSESYIGADSPFCRLDSYIKNSQTKFDFFVGELSLPELFGAAAVNSCDNAKVHILANSQDVTANAFSDLLPTIIDAGLEDRDITLSPSLYTESNILDFLKNYSYQFDLAGYQQFMNDYVHFYVRNKINLHIDNCNSLFGFIFKALLFDACDDLLEQYVSRNGINDSIHYMRLQLLYRRGKYTEVLAYQDADHIGEAHYFKAASAARRKDLIAASRYMASGLEISDKSGNVQLLKGFVGLQNNFSIPDLPVSEQDKKDIMLTTYPEHKSKNVGDNLIAVSALRLLQGYKPDFAPIIRFRETNLAAYNPKSLRAIIAPGFTIINQSYPKYFRLYEDLKKLPPFYPIGCSFQHILPDYRAFEEYVYEPSTIDFLKLVAERSGSLPCRDALIVELLNRNDIPAIYSGDLAIYDKDKINTPFIPPVEIRSVVFTVQHHGKYQVQSVELLHRIRAAFPDADCYVAFHSNPSEMSLEVAAEAVKLGFKELHQYGDVANLDRYDDMDLHIGYRLHGHIAFLRKRKPSVLLVEDARSFGLAKTPGTDIGCFVALDIATEVAAPEVPEQVMSYVASQQKTQWSDYPQLFEFVDRTYEDFIVPTFTKLANLL